MRISAKVIGMVKDWYSAAQGQGQGGLCWKCRSDPDVVITETTCRHWMPGWYNLFVAWTMAFAFMPIQYRRRLVTTTVRKHRDLQADFRHASSVS
jgi:hypothetical protein